MGYFANGSEGCAYEAAYCDRCIHGQDPEKGCAVWDAHLLYSAEFCNAKSNPLNILIPIKGIANEECRMFIQRPAPKFLEGQKELF